MSSLTITALSTPLWHRYPATIAALLSIASALLLIAASQSLNNDGILYLVGADTFKAEGWSAAEKVFVRPFFSALIGTLSLATGTSSLFSAYLLTISLMSLLAFAFVNLVRDLGGKMPAQWAAAAIIVTYPSLCAYRDYLIRDFGYWAFSLLAVNLLIHLHRTVQWRTATTWLLCGLLATLFRPEAAITLFLSPLSILFNTRLAPQARYRATAKLYLYLAAAGVLAMVAGMSLGIDPIGKLLKVTFALYLEGVQGIGANLQNMHNDLVSHVLSRYSREFGALSVVLILTGIFIAKTLQAISLPLLLLGAFLTRCRALTLPRHPAYLATLVIVLMVVAVFYLQMHFLQTRYLLLATLLLLVPICLGLGRVLSTPPGRRSKIILSTLAVILVLDSQVNFGHSNQYRVDSIRWLQTHSAEGDWIYANEPQLAYLGGGSFSIHHVLSGTADMTKIPLNTLAGYDYLAVNLKRKNKVLARFVDSLPPAFTRVKEFSNKRGDKVIIFTTENAAQQRRQPAWAKLAPKAFLNPG